MEKIDIKNLSKDELRKALAEIGEEPYRAAQIFRWLYKTGVISFDEMTDLGKELREKAARILAYLNMGGTAQRNVNTLSTGEKQRACIARALLSDPGLILADEPTGSLDSRNATAILEILKDLNTQQKATILMVTHDDNVMHYAHRRVDIIDGKISSDRSCLPA